MEYTFVITEDRYRAMCQQPFFRNFIAVTPADDEGYVHVKVTVKEPMDIMQLFYGVFSAGERCGNMASRLIVDKSFRKKLFLVR